ncbi:hypothetical protein LCGC14_0318450 [marine sediment metagenome]|uniref:Uncharacterized protein n=1 Tax=marine sediment metagenome TaxID=412755 RepID=A0A0F9W7C8_9ZZZZ
MGIMSMHVEAFKPPNEKWKKMKAVWDSCEEAGIEPPKEVDKFFNREPPDESGVEAGCWSQCAEKKELPPWLKKYSEKESTGFEVDTTQLPEDVSVIRFVCS